MFGDVCIDCDAKNASLCAYWHNAGTRTVPLQLNCKNEFLIYKFEFYKKIKITYVEECESECQLLDTIWWQLNRIINDIEASWCNRTLVNRLWYQIEIVSM